jgi:hypothetical protein
MLLQEPRVLQRPSVTPDALNAGRGLGWLTCHVHHLPLPKPTCDAIGLSRRAHISRSADIDRRSRTSERQLLGDLWEPRRQIFLAMLVGMAVVALVDPER